MDTEVRLTPDDVAAARERIRAMIRTTPVMTSRFIDQVAGASVFFKCEHLQWTGSFKVRGASHAVSLLPENCAGVATHSSGNHGAALAKAAALRGLPAEIAVPRNAVASKVANIRACGGNIHFCDPTQAAREAALEKLVDAGMEAVPPYDDERIISGQGSCALELIEQVPDLDIIVAPIGGGGLISGTALAALGAKRPIRVIGVEPAGADDTMRSLASGERVRDHHPDTIADGLRALVGRRNLALIERHVEHVVCISEQQIVAAMSLIWSHLKQVAEPSGAVALGGVLADSGRFNGLRVGVIISGGNLDVNARLQGLIASDSQDITQ